MAKPTCEVGKKKQKARMEYKPRFRCKECDTRVMKKSWVCKPVKL